MTDPNSQPLSLGSSPVVFTEDLVREIAMDIGKEVASHIETMYPDAVTATSKTMLLSLRNTVFNEIIASLAEHDEAAIRARLARRKVFRRRYRAAWRKIRSDAAGGSEAP